ncbi:MAG: hypothetical protein ABID38_06290 [Candidatus Diapherotrites archaeon]
MKMEINFDRKPVLFLAVLIIGLAIVGLAVAYTSGWSGDAGNPATPPVIGHSADETNVWVNGAAKTLQQAIDDGDLRTSLGTYVGATTLIYDGITIGGYSGGDDKSVRHNFLSQGCVWLGILQTADRLKGVGITHLLTQGLLAVTVKVGQTILDSPRESIGKTIPEYGFAHSLQEYYAANKIALR